MKIAKNIKIGDIVQFPAHQFAPCRSGWNGWIFRAAIVEKLWISKSGEKCATIRYCSRIAGRYQLLPNVEVETSIKCKYLFEYDLAMKAKRYKEFKAYEDDGEQICWDEDTALLINHNLI